jgi:hypothetical protein
MGWEALRSTKRASQPIMADAEGLPRRKGPGREGFPGSTLGRGHSGNKAPPFPKGARLPGLYVLAFKLQRICTTKAAHLVGKEK